MTNYTGIKCPVCGKPFRDGDDIVVCPVCGAPYHRSCYAEAGKCIFTDKHGTPEAWSPPKETKSSRQDASRRCPRCGYVNAAGTLFCAHCGMSLTANEPAGAPQGVPFPGARQVPPGNPPYPGAGYGGPGPGRQSPQQNAGQPSDPFGGPVPICFDPMGGVNPNEPLGGVPAGDVAKFVQNNTQYYLPVFMNLTRFGKSRFNFSAFLCPGAWMLYRKQYKIGSVVTAVMLAIYIAWAYIQQNLWLPLYNAVMTQAGIPMDTAALTSEQVSRLYAILYGLPSSKLLLFMLPSLLALAQLVLMFVFGFIGNRLYLRHCLGSVSLIRRSTPIAGDIPIRLQEQGGVNTPIALCFIVCYMILSYLPLWI